MAMKKIVTKYDGSAEFVVGDHHVNVKFLHPRAVAGSTGHATQVGDRYVVTAGTLIEKDGAPLGFCYRDVDVTDGDAMLAVTVHAVVKESALPAVVSAENKAALKGIIFV